MNIPYAFSFNEVRLSTTSGSDIEHNKFGDQVSTILKVISNKDGDIISHIDKFNENDIPVPKRLLKPPPQISDTPHQEMLINNHTDANKSKIK